jgi:enoyl-[acyl-carrier protein] reductase III
MMTGDMPARAGNELAADVVVVTGGSKGIGRAIALDLARQGAAVAITWFRDRRQMQVTQAAIEKLGRPCLCVRAVLAEEDAPQAVIDEVERRLGPPSIVVSNAATGVQLPVAEVSDRIWRRTMETNAGALLRLVRATPKARSVLALSSLGSRRVLPHYGVVGASKAAMEALVRYYAAEMAPDCTVNAICAGVVDTESLRRFPAAAEILAESERRTPMGRLTTPSDIAALASFLVSPRARMITGQILTIDGGYSLWA